MVVGPPHWAGAVDMPLLPGRHSQLVLQRLPVQQWWWLQRLQLRRVTMLRATLLLGHRRHEQHVHQFSFSCLS